MAEEGKRTCPHCGAAVEETDLYCLECGNSLESVQQDLSDVPEPEIQDEKTQESVLLDQLDKLKTSYDIAKRKLSEQEEAIRGYVRELEHRDETQKTDVSRSKKWVKAFWISTVLLLMVVAVLSLGLITVQGDLTDLEYKVQRLNYQYNDLETEHNDLKTDYNALDADYNVLQSKYDAFHSLIEYNGLDELYHVEVNEVFNGDLDWNKIGDALVYGSIDRLTINITIRSTKETDLWSEPLYVSLYKPDGTLIGDYETSTYDSDGNLLSTIRYTWDIEPEYDYDDTKTSCRWNMGTKDITQAGTYLAVFTCNGLIVEQCEIEVS